MGCKSYTEDCMGRVFELSFFQAYVVKSGKLITGQNPASAKPIGDELLKVLSA